MSTVQNNEPQTQQEKIAKFVTLFSMINKVETDLNELVKYKIYMVLDHFIDCLSAKIETNTFTELKKILYGIIQEVGLLNSNDPDIKNLIYFVADLDEIGLTMTNTEKKKKIKKYLADYYNKKGLVYDHNLLDETQVTFDVAEFGYQQIKNRWHWDIESLVSKEFACKVNDLFQQKDSKKITFDVLLTSLRKMFENHTAQAQVLPQKIADYKRDIGCEDAMNDPITNYIHTQDVKPKNSI